MRRFEWPLALISTLLAAIFLFQSNLHTDDTGIIAGLLFIFAAVLAFLFCKPGLLFGSLLGLSIVLSEIWNFRFGIPRTQHVTSFPLRAAVLVCECIKRGRKPHRLWSAATLRKTHPSQT